VVRSCSHRREMGAVLSLLVVVEALRYTRAPGGCRDRARVGV
jgi:hypothetical protein